MGQNGRKDDDNTRRKLTPSLSSHESIVQRSAQSKGGGKLSIHYCADQDTITTVFRSSVFTGQSQKCVNNMNPFMREDPLWENSQVPRSCQV